ncbi:DUF6978 family protein [Desemzia sp. FAM 24101]|uniref:DUF6978 family protein n=1 Tax=unclassified Desemzia TaxID=2685243 RepID=UPI00388B1863
MELLLTDAEAYDLIKLLKNVIKKHRKVITYPTNGTIQIKSFSDDQRKFELMYFLTETKKTFQFLDKTTNLTLLRINLNNGFHKNANGERFRGNRINIFSEEEFILKNDGHTHTKSYPLPYRSITNTTDVFVILKNILEYANIQNKEMIQLTVQDGFDI